jgi:HEAT repeat protein
VGKLVRSIRNALSPKASVPCWAVAALASLGMCGCANFWEKVTSRDFKFEELYKPSPNPLVVIANTKDGDKRAAALRALREPKQHGGTDAEQDLVVTVLVAAAEADAQPLCRLAAIHSLGYFKDPRAVQGLIDAFYAVNQRTQQSREQKKVSNRLDALASNGNEITLDTATIIQVEALSSLGRTKNPAALELLTSIARPEPAAAVEKVSAKDKQQVLDLKVAAVRALGNFSQSQSTEALLLVLEKEKDVALHDRAVESLELATGKKLGDDAKAWEDTLHNSSGDTATAGAKKPALLKLVGAP